MHESQREREKERQSMLRSCIENYLEVRALRRGIEAWVCAMCLNLGIDSNNCFLCVGARSTSYNLPLSFKECMYMWFRSCNDVLLTNTHCLSNISQMYVCVYVCIHGWIRVLVREHHQGTIKMDWWGYDIFSSKISVLRFFFFSWKRKYQCLGPLLDSKL